MKIPWGRFLFDDFKKFLAEVSFHFHLELCKNIFEWLVFYLSKKERARNQCQNKWNKDFLTETGFLRSLFLIINEKLDQILSKLLTLSQCFTCILIVTFCFEMLNILEQALRYFIIDNNYKLLITSWRDDVILNEPIKNHELIKLASQRRTRDRSSKDNNNSFESKKELVVWNKEEAKNVMFWLEKDISKVENTLFQWFFQNILESQDENRKYYHADFYEMDFMKGVVILVKVDEMYVQYLEVYKPLFIGQEMR